MECDVGCSKRPREFLKPLAYPVDREQYVNPQRARGPVAR
jgi:hypothetical protein